MATAVTVLALPFLLQSGKATGVAAVAPGGGSGNIADALPTPAETEPIAAGRRRHPDPPQRPVDDLPERS